MHHARHEEEDFNDTVKDIANELGKLGHEQLAEFILAQIGAIRTFNISD
jgi:hypothetical protein